MADGTDILEQLRALADPTRLRIVRLLGKMELSVGEIAHLLEQSQPRISRHVRILVEAGLAERQKEGSWVFLRPGPALYRKALAGLLEDEDFIASDEARADLEQLSRVRTERARHAESWFAEHADEWDSLRVLYIDEAEVETEIREMLAVAPLGRVADIGTGTGRMVEILADKAEQVTGIDNSAEMLRVARAKLSALPADGSPGDSVLEWKIGDFNALPLADASQDTIVMHQALHYAQAPDQVIGEMVRVLAPGGRLLIADFDRHDREELRKTHAHVRLGFSDRTMRHWMQAEGLNWVETRRLAGGELDILIWLARKPEQAGSPVTAKTTASARHS